VAVNGNPQPSDDRSRDIVIDRAAGQIVYRVLDNRTSLVVSQYPDEVRLRAREVKRRSEPVRYLRRGHYELTVDLAAVVHNHASHTLDQLRQVWSRHAHHADAAAPDDGGRRQLVKCIYDAPGKYHGFGLRRHGTHTRNEQEPQWQGSHMSP
jgi:hypothetical protein